MTSTSTSTPASTPLQLKELETNIVSYIENTIVEPIQNKYANKVDGVYSFNVNHYLYLCTGYEDDYSLKNNVRVKYSIHIDSNIGTKGRLPYIKKSIENGLIQLREFVKQFNLQDDTVRVEYNKSYTGGNTFSSEIFCSILLNIQSNKIFYSCEDYNKLEYVIKYENGNILFPTQVISTYSRGKSITELSCIIAKALEEIPLYIKESNKLYFKYVNHNYVKDFILQEGVYGMYKGFNISSDKNVCWCKCKEAIEKDKFYSEYPV